MIDLIDLCSLQGNPDWTKVAKAGFRGAIAKSSQYSSTADHKFDAYVSGMRAAGIAPGAYHFAYCGADPVAQARFFYKASQGVGSQEGEIPPVLDLEFAKNIAPDVIVDWGVAFMAEAKNLWYPHSDRLPMLYTYPYFAASLGEDLKKLSGYPLWIASYKANKGPEARWYPKDTDRPHLPKFWDKATVWQYSGNGGLPVPGISVDCDRDVFLGSSAEWDEFLGKKRPPNINQYKTEDFICPSGP